MDGGGSVKGEVGRVKFSLFTLHTSSDPDLFNDFVLAGFRSPDRERAAHPGIGIVPVPIRAADLGRFLHMLPAFYVIRTFVIEAHVKILRTPGRKGRGPPLVHLAIAIWTDSFVFLHFILLSLCAGGLKA